MKKTLFLAFFLIVSCAIGLAKEIPSERDPWGIGVLRDQIKEGKLNVVMLQRRDYDSIRSWYDGLIFTTAPTRYRYIRRQNDNYVLKLNAAQGKESAPVTAEELGKYEVMIKQSQFSRNLLRDKDGKIALIVFCYQHDSVVWNREKNGEIYLEVRDVFRRNMPGTVSERLNFRDVK